MSLRSWSDLFPESQLSRSLFQRSHLCFLFVPVSLWSLSILVLLLRGVSHYLQVSRHTLRGARTGSRTRARIFLWWHHSRTLGSQPRTDSDEAQRRQARTRVDWRRRQGLGDGRSWRRCLQKQKEHSTSRQKSWELHRSYGECFDFPFEGIVVYFAYIE